MEVLSPPSTPPMGAARGPFSPALPSTEAAQTVARTSRGGQSPAVVPGTGGARSDDLDFGGLSLFDLAAAPVEELAAGPLVPRSPLPDDRGELTVSQLHGAGGAAGSPVAPPSTQRPSATASVSLWQQRSQAGSQVALVPAAPAPASVAAASTPARAQLSPSQGAGGDSRTDRGYVAVASSVVTSLPRATNNEAIVMRLLEEHRLTQSAGPTAAPSAPAAAVVPRASATTGRVSAVATGAGRTTTAGPPRRSPPPLGGARRAAPAASPPRERTGAVLAHVFRTELARTHLPSPPLRLGGPHGATTAAAASATRNPRTVPRTRRSAGAGGEAPSSTRSARPPAYSTLTVLASQLARATPGPRRQKLLGRLEFMIPTLPAGEDRPFLERHLAPVLQAWAEQPPPVMVPPGTHAEAMAGVQEAWAAGECLLRLFVAASASVEYVAPACAVACDAVVVQWGCCGYCTLGKLGTACPLLLLVPVLVLVLVLSQS